MGLEEEGQARSGTGPRLEAQMSKEADLSLASGLATVTRICKHFPNHVEHGLYGLVLYQVNIAMTGPMIDFLALD